MQRSSNPFSPRRTWGKALAMVYGAVVNRLGGTVTFETEVGRGTTFIVRLPLKPKADAKHE